MDADDEQKPFDTKNPSNNRSFRSNSQQNNTHQNNQNHPSQQQNPFGSITSTFSSQLNSQSQTSINSASARENNGSGDRSRLQNTARPAPLQPGTYLLVNNSQNRTDSLASNSPAVAAPFSSTEISSQTSQNSQNTSSSATTVSTASPLIQTVEIL